MDSIAQISFTERTAAKKKSEINLKLAESIALDHDLILSNENVHSETKYTEKFLIEKFLSYGIPSVNAAGRILPKDLFDQVSNKSDALSDAESQVEDINQLTVNSTAAYDDEVQILPKEEKILPVVDLAKTANEYKSASQLNTEISHIGKIKTEEPSDEEIESELPASKDYFDHVYIIGEHNPLSEETKSKLNYIFIECNLSPLDVSNFNTLFESMEPIKPKSVCILLFNFSVITKTEASLKVLIPRGFKNDTAIHVLNWSPNDSLYTGQEYIHSRVKLLIEIIKIISKKVKVVVLPLEPTRINVLLNSDLTKSHQPSEDGYFVWGSNDKWAMYRTFLVENWKMLLKMNGCRRISFQYGPQHIFPISIHELNSENMEEIKKNWRQNANDIVLKLCGKKIQDSEISEEPKIYSSDDICTQNSDSSLEPVKCCVSIRKLSNSIPDGFFDDLVKILEPEAAFVHVEGRTQILFTSHKGNLFSKVLNGHYIGDTALGATLLCSGCYIPTNTELHLMQVALQNVELYWNPTIMKNVQKNLLQGLNFTCYKTVKCEKENCNIFNCIFYHSDADRRRNPLNIPYLDEPCLHNPCLWLDRCSRTHNVFEKMLHPKNMYKEPCPQFLSREECFRTNPLCLSAHGDSPELFFSTHWKDMLVTGTIYTFQYLAGAIRRFNVADPLFQNCRIFVIGANRKFLSNLKNSVEELCDVHHLSCSSVGKVDGMHHVLFGTPSAYNTKCKFYNLVSFNVVIISQLNQIMSQVSPKNNLIQFLNRFKLHSQPPYIQKLFVADSHDIIHNLGFDEIFKSELEHLLGETIHTPSGDPESIVQFKYDVPHYPMIEPDWLPYNSPPPVYRLYLNTVEISQKSIETPTVIVNEVSSSFVRITEDCLQSDSQNAFISQPYQGDVNSFLVDLDGRSNSDFTKRPHQSSLDLSERSAKTQDTSSGNNNGSRSPRPRQSRSKSPRSRRKKSTLKNNRSRSRSPRSFSSRHRRSKRNKSRSKSPRPRRSRSRSMSSKRKRSRSKSPRSLESKRNRSRRCKSKSSRSKRNCNKSSSSSPLPANKSIVVPYRNSNSISPERISASGLGAPSSDASVIGNEKVLVRYENEAETDEENTQVENRLLHMLKISSKCYIKDSFLKRLGKELFKEFKIEERLVCLKLDEEFEVYRKMPDMCNKYEECYGSFIEKYTLKFPDEDEEHKDRFWRAFWESEFEYVKKCELKHRIWMLMTEYVNKSSCALPSVSLPSVPIAPSPFKSVDNLRYTITSKPVSSYSHTPFIPPVSKSFGSFSVRHSSSVLPTTTVSSHISPFVPHVVTSPSVNYGSIFYPVSTSFRVPSVSPYSLPSPVPAPSVILSSLRNANFIASSSIPSPIPASSLPVPGFTTITPSSLSVPVPVPSITAPVPASYITPSSLTTSIPVPFITPSRVPAPIPVPSLTPFLPAPGPVPFPFPSIVAPLVPASSSRTRSRNESEKIAKSYLSQEISSTNTVESFPAINLRSLSQKLKEEENMKDSEGIENDIEKTLATLEIVVPDMGIFGLGVASILEKVKDLGKTTKEALKLFTESDNIAILEMALKITKSKCTSEEKVIFLDILEKDIRKLLEYAQQVQKEENRINVEANSAIIDMIRNAALYQGLELDNKEVTQMILQVCSHLKNQ